MDAPTRIHHLSGKPVRRRFGGPDSPGRKYLLSGSARCDVCNGPSRVLPCKLRNGQPYWRYFCHQSHCVSRSVEKVDDFVTAVVVARLARKDAHELLIDRSRPDMAELTAQANAIRARRDGYSAEFADDDSVPLATKSTFSPTSRSGKPRRSCAPTGTTN